MDSQPIDFTLIFSLPIHFEDASKTSTKLRSENVNKDNSPQCHNSSIFGMFGNVSPSLKTNGFRSCYVCKGKGHVTGLNVDKYQRFRFAIKELLVLWVFLNATETKLQGNCSHYYEKC